MLRPDSMRFTPSAGEDWCPTNDESRYQEVEEIAYTLMRSRISEEWEFAFSRATVKRGNCDTDARLIRLSRSFALSHDDADVRAELERLIATAERLS